MRVACVGIVGVGSSGSLRGWGGFVCLCVRPSIWTAVGVGSSGFLCVMVDRV